MVLLFDGECRFCTDGIGWLQRRFDPAAPSMAATGDLDAVEWVGGDVRLTGADAVAAWLRTARRLRPLTWFFPVGLPLGRLVYPVVARNRGRISRLWR